MWPFAAGMVVGWLVLARRAVASVRGGLLVCLATVAVGMGLRVLSGQGTAPAFIAVSLGFLGTVMVGGRLLLGAGRRLLGAGRLLLGAGRRLLPTRTR